MIRKLAGTNNLGQTWEGTGLNWEMTGPGPRARAKGQGQGPGPRAKGQTIWVRRGKGLGLIGKSHS